MEHVLLYKTEKKKGWLHFFTSEWSLYAVLCIGQMYVLNITFVVISSWEMFIPYNFRKSLEMTEQITFIVLDALYFLRGVG